MIKTKLFSTFINIGDLDDTLDTLFSLKDNGVGLKGKIFVLDNLRNTDQLIVTFNIEGDSDALRHELPIGSIPVHRNKSTNTLYSINALNEIIRAFNNGVVDPTVEVPWKHYANMFLIIRNSELHIIPTRLQSVIELEKV